MEMRLAAPIVAFIQSKFCRCGFRAGKCGVELRQRSLEKEFGDSWGVGIVAAERAVMAV